MMFCVRVPVLSERNMSIPARSSVDANRDTMACLPAKLIHLQLVREILGHSHVQS